MTVAQTRKNLTDIELECDELRGADALRRKEKAQRVWIRLYDLPGILVLQEVHPEGHRLLEKRLKLMKRVRDYLGGDEWQVQQDHQFRRAADDVANAKAKRRRSIEASYEQRTRRVERLSRTFRMGQARRMKCCHAQLDDLAQRMRSNLPARGAEVERLSASMRSSVRRALGDGQMRIECCERKLSQAWYRLGEDALERWARQRPSWDHSGALSPLDRQLAHSWRKGSSIDRQRLEQARFAELAAIGYYGRVGGPGRGCLHPST